jgi:hypothetical protein
VRIVLAGFLALRRQWWHLAAFAAASVLSEVLIGSLKGSYDRARMGRLADPAETRLRLGLVKCPRAARRAPGQPLATGSSRLAK